MDDCFKDIWVTRDKHVTDHIVDSIERLQLLYGKIPHVFSIGTIA